MRTPGNDVELAVGFLYAEGFIQANDDVIEVAHCARGDVQKLNIVEVRLAAHVLFDESRVTRSFPVTSSCGVCGAASLDALETAGLTPVGAEHVRISSTVIAALPERLRSAQELFEQTGGLHAAGLFAKDGSAFVVREDVGRHNAVDKVVGHALLGGATEERVLVVSGRTSFEILQKAVRARVPMVVSVGAPSSLAVELARRFGVTLVGFARPDGFNVYAGEQRIT
jgi:FdhD protein